MHTHAHSTHAQLFYDPFSGATRVSRCPKEEIFFWTTSLQGKITQADTPTIRLGATPSGLISNLLPSFPHFFYARCRSCRNAPNLSWLGTGTKYAGLHTSTQRLVCAMYKSCISPHCINTAQQTRGTGAGYGLPRSVTITAATAHHDHHDQLSNAT